VEADTQQTIEAVWHIESARLIARLARIVRDVGAAEDLAQDAYVAALEQWPQTGVPAKPGAWLMAAARNRAIDAIRRRRTLERKRHVLARDLEIEAELEAPDFDELAADDVGDDMLRLIFTCCHPVLPAEARVALSLRLLGGLTTDEIGRAYLLPTPTIAQRITRAKRTLAEAHVPYELPAAPDLAERLASVQEVIYLIFNEGYSATAGEDWLRPELCNEALRLGRVLARLMPDEPEVHGLAALMELQASRLRARVGAGGRPILLLDQDRGRWDRLLIGRGLAALTRAESFGGTLGQYGLQAAIAACHARARSADETDWVQIVALYDALAQVAPSPVVELNRAMAVAMAYGPAEGLEIIDGLADEPALRSYHLLPSARAELLIRLGRLDEARGELARAAALTRNEQDRRMLLTRAAELPAGQPPERLAN